MSRQGRIEFPDALYHVMGRGVARMPVFLDDRDREELLSRMARLVDRGDLIVLAFCLMHNHVHILCQTPRGALGRWMQLLMGGYALWFNRRHRRVGHLWQGRYKALLVDNGEYLLECSRYIHLNPNRSKITRPAERYRWSSYRNYLGGPAVVSWVDTHPVLAAFPAGGRKHYRSYIESGRGEKPVDPFERATAGLVLGGVAFVAKIRRMARALADDREIPSLLKLKRADRPSTEEVETAVEEIFARASRRRRGRLLLYALRRHSSLRGTEIARRYARTPAAVSVATGAVENEARQSRALALQLKQLAARLSLLSLRLVNS